jgi:hypothetical protein
MHYSAFDGKAVADPFLHAFGKIVTLWESILEDCLLVQKELFDSTEADLQQQALRDEMQLAAEMARHCIEENALKAEDQTESLRQYEQYTQHYEKLKKKYDALLIHQQKRKEDHNRLSQFIAMLQNQTELPVKFHEDLWLATVDKVTVCHSTVVFTFRCGFEVTEEI